MDNDYKNYFEQIKTHIKTKIQKLEKSDKIFSVEWMVYADVRAFINQVEKGQANKPTKD